tara:strand:+ start:9659 stop:10579 length:921 start_codon:yes stop_codon:yes gene_type:complete
LETLSKNNFIKVFGEEISSFVSRKIDSFDFSYEVPTPEEKDKLLLNILKTIDNPPGISGEHRIDAWEKGWGENCNEIKIAGDFNSLIPKYFGKHPYVRWQKELIRPSSKDFEYNMAQVLQYWLFEKYFSSVDNIYEFGCGTGHNLFRAQEINPTADIFGLDWTKASQETIFAINESFNKHFKSHNFNFFNIDYDFDLKNNSGVYTFAALEQVGNSHDDFINYLIEKKCKVCLHIEPIGELLDYENNLNDDLSVRYFKARNYLNSFYDYLCELESKGKINILQRTPSFIGSQYINGYSIVAWEPKNA